MLQVKDIIVSSDLIEEFFCCDISKCFGMCCVEGDMGAPLEEEEEQILNELLPKLQPYLSPEGKKEIEKNGLSYIDEEGERTTSLINGKECVFTYRDREEDTYRCAIEKAWEDGIIPFKKPISCHLYPIRVKKYKHFTALNYDEWSICKNACICGKKEGIKLYVFLKEPLIRRFGKEWYEELCRLCEEDKEHKA